MLIKTDPAIIAGYLEDASGFTCGSADRIVIPENESELADYLQQASQQRESITISGGRTGVAAGCIPRGGAILSIEQFTRLGPIEKNNQGYWIQVQPGVRLESLKETAHAAGLLYGPDPTERTGTLGGNVATNASGGQCFKYGPTRGHVLGLEAILSSGEKLNMEREQVSYNSDLLRYPLSSGRILECKRPQLPPLKVGKNAAGYYSLPGMDPLDLLIGMDGTLAVITNIKLRLLRAPQGIFSLAIFFTDLKLALHCADLIRRSSPANHFSSGISPCSLEFMDKHSLDLLQQEFPALPQAAQAALLVEQEYAESNEEADLACWENFLADLNIPETMIWFAQTDRDRERIRKFRHALPELVNSIVRKRKFQKVGSDMAVPPEAFSAMFEFYTRGLDASGLDYLIFGHIGECHLHVNVLPKNQIEFDRAKNLYWNFARKAVSCGGTVSAEHGIGKIKHDFLKLMVGEEGFREMARVKRCFDPALILNRGNIFPEEYLEETLTS